MEENEPENNERIPNPTPKKIALKVPSLFIKGPSSGSVTQKVDKDEKKSNGDLSQNIKASRPMPASARKKLEQQQDESNEDTKAVRRPMPASARRKLEDNLETEETSGNKFDVSKNSRENVENEKDDDDAGKISLSAVVRKPNQKPMPASAKRSLEPHVSDDSKNKEESSRTGSPKPRSRPMPASAKRKLDVLTGTKHSEHDKNEGSPSASENRTENDLKDLGNGSIEAEISTEEKTEETKKRLGSIREKEQRSNSDDDRKENPEHKVKEPIPNQEIKKISLSLGGIRLPNFKKSTPAPAPVRSEAEEKNGEKGSDKTSESEENYPDLNETRDSETKSGHDRRTGRRSGVGEFLALEDPRHVCEICGTAFTNAYAKKKHCDRIHLGIKDDKAKKESKKKDPFEKVRTCPICNEKRRFSNKKMFRDHIRKCKMPRKNCALCELKFTSEKELIKHIKSHAQPKDGEENPPDISVQSMFDTHDISVPASPMSVPAEKEEEKDDDKVSDVSIPSLEKQATEEPRKSSRENLNRKIAQALTNLTKNSKRKSTDVKDKNGDLKSMDKEGNESIRGRPMPASIKKKLEERINKEGDESAACHDNLACRICKQRFFNRQNRIRHEKTVHSYHEPDIGIKLPSRPRATETENRPPGISKLRCQYCSKLFRNTSHRRRHEQTVHELKAEGEIQKKEISVISPAKPKPRNNEKQCRFCQKIFQARWKLKRHERDVHIKKGQKLTPFSKGKVSSPVVAKSFSESDINDKQCRFCGKTFARRYNKKQHELIVHARELREQKLSSAKHNDQKSTSAIADVKKESIKKDRSDQKASSIKPKRQPSLHECEVCYRKFTQADNRRRHEKTVHNIVNPRAGSSSKMEALTDKSIVNEKDHEENEDSVEHSGAEDCNSTFEEADNPQMREAYRLLSTLNSQKGGRCPFCKKLLRHKLRYHLLRVHNVKSPPSKQEGSRPTDKEDSESGMDLDDTVESPETDQEPEEEENPEMKEAKRLFNTLKASQGGRCPICKLRLQTKLSRHFTLKHNLKPTERSAPVERKSERSAPAERKSERSAAAERKSERSKINSDSIAAVEHSESEHDHDQTGSNVETQGMKEAIRLANTLNHKVGGRCPICKIVFQTQLRRHLARRHKLTKTTESSAHTSLPDQLKAKTSAPSFKTFKATSDKIRKKLNVSSIGSINQKSMSAKQNTPNRIPNKDTRTDAVASKDFDCPCCDEVFTLEDNYEELKAMRQPRKKFYIACKICWNMFSHQEDFLLHMKFRHKDTSSSIPSQESSKKPSPKIPAQSLVKENRKSERRPSIPTKESTSFSSTRTSLRNLRKSISHEPSPPPPKPALLQREKDIPKSKITNSSFTKNVDAKRLARSMPKCTIKISESEQRRAERLLKKLNSHSVALKKSDVHKRHASRKSRRSKHRKRSKRASSPPKQMDTYGESDGYDEAEPVECDNDDVDHDDSRMDVEEAPELAITSTFSQKQKSSEDKGNSSINDYGLDEMPCSTCNEVFYSFEALRKHELYIHNVKTSNMCPICGVYPTKLSRHLLAHENKTIRCSCAPCALNFANFKQLREHNFKNHTKSVADPDGEVKKGQGEVETSYRYKCLLCKKDYDGEVHVKSHIRKTHYDDLKDHPSNLFEKIEVVAKKDSEEDKMEIEQILEDTNAKLMDSDWDSDADDRPPLETSKSTPLPTDQARTIGKPGRPMPASVRAKLEAAEKKKKEEEKAKALLEEEKRARDREEKEKALTKLKLEKRKREEEEEERSKSEKDAKEREEKGSSQAEVKPKPVKRPMPASVRAKLESQLNTKSVEEKEQETTPVSDSPSSVNEPSRKEEAVKPKPSRPMPASVRAKLMTQTNSTSSNSSDAEKEVGRERGESNARESVVETVLEKPVARPNRPMPASVRAKLKNKAELKEIPSTQINEVVAGPSDDENVPSAPPSPEANDKKDDDSDYVPSAPPSPQASLEANKDDDSDYVPSATSSPQASPEMNDKDNSDDVPSLTSSPRGKDNDDQDNAPSVPVSTSASPEREEVQLNEDGKTKKTEKDKPKENDKNTDEITTSQDDDVVVLSDNDEAADVNAEESYPIQVQEGKNLIAESEAHQTTPEEMTEHDKMVRIAMGQLDPTVSGCNVTITYQCKLCSKPFDTVDSIRRHIRRGHSEYGPEHTENLIEQIYEETTTEATQDPSRKRRRTTRYTEEEYLDAHDELEEDDEAEVIVRRGTSSRGLHDQEQLSESSSHQSSNTRKEKLPPDLCKFACKFCGKRMDTSSNTKRHISKSHPDMYKKGVNGVIVIQPGTKLPDVPLVSEKKTKNSQELTHLKGAKGFKCRVCHWKLQKYGSIYQHIRRSHPETSNDKIVNYIDPIFDGGEKNLTWGGETESQVSTFSCILCNFSTSEEHDYVRHYKEHTGVSPYQCQYCAGTFNRNQQLLAHIEREHTGAEFLNENEDEFVMEEMTGVSEIQVSTTVPIQIDQQKPITLNRTFRAETEGDASEASDQNEDESDNNDHDDDQVPNEEEDDDRDKSPEPKRRKPGPASRRGKKSVGKQAIVKTERPQPSSPAESPPASPSEPEQNEAEENHDNESDDAEEEAPAPHPTSQPRQGGSAGFQYQGDLSSLFSTLGGENPGGLEAMDDIDGGMSLD